MSAVATDDPFFDPSDANKTIIRPRPGGKRAPTPTAPPPPPRESAPITIGLPNAGLNPLLTAAAPLLTVVTQLRNTLSHHDIDGLRNRLVEEVKQFETNARGEGISPEASMTARYVLCALIDETVLGTPWGSESIWSKQGLLITFHNETWGGEKFFLLLDRLVQDPTGNRNLLELMYICLTLGFEGRYRVLEGGYRRLDELREQLYRTLRHQYGEFEQDLSPHWQGIADKRNPLIRYVPLWVLAAVACALLLVMYIGFSFSLNRNSNPVLTALHNVGNDAATIFTRPKPKPRPAQTPKLRGFLEQDIRDGLVDVREQYDQTTVLIRGDGLFGSGSDSVNSSFEPLLTRIAEALMTVPGRILVTGHTDNIPIHTLRFPSNWHLSQKRAEAVARKLGDISGSPQRFTPEGRADTEPLVPNDTPNNRARNRRVEIILMKAGWNPS